MTAHVSISRTARVPTMQQRQLAAVAAALERFDGAGALTILDYRESPLLAIVYTPEREAQWAAESVARALRIVGAGARRRS